jgi:hypothetical protein
LEKIGNNAFRLDLPSYMQIYVVVNVENLRLYEPPLIEDQGENVQIPSIEDFSPEYLDELQQDTILDRRTRSSKREVWIIFEWGSREQILQRPNG